MKFAQRFLLIPLLFASVGAAAAPASAAEKYYCRSYCAVYYGGRLQIGQGYSGWVEAWSDDWELAWKSLENKCFRITGYANLHGRLQVSDRDTSYPSPGSHCQRL